TAWIVFWLGPLPNRIQILTSFVRARIWFRAARNIVHPRFARSSPIPASHLAACSKGCEARRVTERHFGLTNCAEALGPLGQNTWRVTARRFKVTRSNDEAPHSTKGAHGHTLPTAFRRLPSAPTIPPVFPGSVPPTIFPAERNSRGWRWHPSAFGRS